MLLSFEDFEFEVKTQFGHSKSKLNLALKKYTSYTIQRMNNYIHLIDKYESHNDYKEYIKLNLQKLEDFKIIIEKIPLTTFNPQKINSLFYRIYFYYHWL